MNKEKFLKLIYSNRIKGNLNYLSKIKKDVIYPISKFGKFSINNLTGKIHSQTKLKLHDIDAKRIIYKNNNQIRKNINEFVSNNSIDFNSLSTELKNKLLGKMDDK